MPKRYRSSVAPFRRMRLVEVDDRQANEQQAYEKLIRHDDPIVSSMARVLPLIRNPKRTKNAAADLAATVANMQHYKALERQRKPEEVQTVEKGMGMAMEREMEAAMGTLSPLPDPKPKRKRKTVGTKRAKSNLPGLFSPRRTRKNDGSGVLRVYK